MAATAGRPVEEAIEKSVASDGADALAAASANAIHLNTADGDSEPLQLPSLCMRCHDMVRVNDQNPVFKALSLRFSA